ncbi:DNA modification system-associated small protein [Fredinandcohnia onubensis]|uniref:DNA modification system-associated small protein n=1 Tax=Fredinandcohnia onubensis TaxID=1571209 RepID=UPI000C0BBEB3|nr:DNA modification system-associated small protein [Fredinandcohnia onubensis]
MNSTLKEKELELLAKVAKENNLPIKMLHQFIKSAEKFSYENLSPGARKKEYTDLISFYAKQNKGDD